MKAFRDFSVRIHLIGLEPYCKHMMDGWMTRFTFSSTVFQLYQNDEIVIERLGAIDPRSWLNGRPPQDSTDLAVPSSIPAGGKYSTHSDTGDPL